MQALDFLGERRFFWRGDFAFFQGFLGILGAQNVVFCVVNRGGFVVNSWWKAPLKSGLKICRICNINFGRTSKVTRRTWSSWVEMAVGVENRISPLRAAGFLGGLKKATTVEISAEKVRRAVVRRGPRDPTLRSG